MRLNNNNFFSWKKVLFLTLVPMLMASVTLSDKVSFPISQFFNLDPLSFQKAYYNVVNRDSNARHIDDPSHYITILDIHNIDSRRSIAEVIDNVCRLSPKVVGIDLIFDSYRNPDDDKFLADVIYKNSEKLVLACGFDGKDYYYSFFGKDNLFSGAVGTYDPLRVKQYIDSSHREKSFPYLMAERGELLSPDIPNEVLINYTNRHFDVLTITDSTDLVNFFSNEYNRRRIEDCNVIINDLSLPYDQHPGLFLINGQTSQHGAVLIAYQLFALIDSEGRISNASLWQNLLICFLFTLLFSIAFCLLDYWIKKANNRSLKGLAILSKLLILYVMEIVVFIFGMYFIMQKLIVPNSIFIMLSILLMDTANYIYNETIKSK